MIVKDKSCRRVSPLQRLHSIGGVSFWMGDAVQFLEGVAIALDTLGLSDPGRPILVLRQRFDVACDGVRVSEIHMVSSDGLAPLFADSTCVAVPIPKRASDAAYWEKRFKAIGPAIIHRAMV